MWTPPPDTEKLLVDLALELTGAPLPPFLDVDTSNILCLQIHSCSLPSSALEYA